MIRQGDWFFIPMPTGFQLPDNAVIYRDATLGGPMARSFGIRVGHPHFADEQSIVIGDRMVYERGKWVARSKVVRAIYVRVKVRHSEHSTVEFMTWHQAVQNGMTNPPLIGYYD